MPLRGRRAVLWIVNCVCVIVSVGVSLDWVVQGRMKGFTLREQCGAGRHGSEHGW